MTWSDISQLRRGDVVTVPFPFTDLSGSKNRVAIVVSDTLKVRGPDGHFVFCGTQNPPRHIVTIPVREGTPDAAAMGLRYDPGVTTTYVYPTKLVTLEVRLIHGRIGQVPAPLMAQITEVLRSALGC